MSNPHETPPDQCPEPFWHDTHYYCPCCTWVSPNAPQTVEQKRIAQLDADLSAMTKERDDLKAALADLGRWSREQLLSEIEKLQADLAAMTEERDRSEWVAEALARDARPWAEVDTAESYQQCIAEALKMKRLVYDCMHPALARYQPAEEHRCATECEREDGAPMQCDPGPWCAGYTPAKEEES